MSIFTMTEMIDRNTPASNLSIDKQLDEISLHPRFRDQIAARDFVRLALEKACGQADEARELVQMAAVIADWKRTAEAAKRASVAVDVLLRNLCGGQPNKGALVGPLRQMNRHLAQGANYSIYEANAKAQADTLSDAAGLLQQLASYMAQRRKELATGRTNPGEPVKAAFVFTIAEAWTFLTGRRPGLGTEYNPFLRFVEAAWQDAGGGRDDNFVAALRAAVRKLPAGNAEGFIPHWAEAGWLPKE